MKLYIFCIAMMAVATCFSQGRADTNRYLVSDTALIVRDTTVLIRTRIGVGHFFNKSFNLDLMANDTILYSIEMEKERNLKYKIIDPSGDGEEFKVQGDTGNVWLRIPVTGNYVFDFKNNLFHSSNISLTLKKVHSRVEKKRLLKRPPIQVTLYDTVPRIILQGTYYIGATRNIKSESRKVIQFKFVADSVPCYWAYVVGFGKDYEQRLSELVDLKSQAPVGDPLVAHFTKNFYGFPKSSSKRAKLILSGPKVIKGFSTTDFNVHAGRRGLYSLTVDNADEVVGEYIYFEVMAFDFIEKEVVSVPFEEYQKMKVARCLGN